MPAIHRRTLLAAALGLPLLPSRLGAQTAVTGWREAVLIVPELAPWIGTLTEIGGWEILAHTPPDAALSAFWSLPAGASAEQVVMHNAGTQTGFLRLVRIQGAQQRRIRPDDQAWETGGISALDLRVVDIEATRAALLARGWHAPSDPVRYKTYGVEVIQWAPESPDGIRLSFIQRIAPALVGWGELKRWSRSTNAAIMVRDTDAAQAFFAGALGLAQTSHSTTIGSDGPNVMGLPFALARRLAIEIRGFSGGVARGDGAVELIAMPELRGRDYAADAHPPNLGIAALRIAVADAAAMAARLSAFTAAPLQEMPIAPYGRCRVFACTAPDGVRLEFFEGG